MRFDFDNRFLAELPGDPRVDPGRREVREALWSRISAADFLSESEKRRMAGVDQPERAS